MVREDFSFAGECVVECVQVPLIAAQVKWGHGTGQKMALQSDKKCHFHGWNQKIDMLMTVFVSLSAS